ncbi:MAG: putative aminohydrolase SsnA [Defluviitaleaceae bacterium]|nr:putative aminohydrolase SsnA [Defluviitaleaceae bacterium]
MQLIGNGRLVTRNASAQFIANGCVAVDDTVIADFGTTAEMRAKYPDAEFFDVGGKVIMPGLINTHMHIYSAFARGMSLKNSPVNKNFSMILENLWWRVDKVLNIEDVKYSAYATLIDCIKYGVTTVFDHHASQNYIEGSLFAIADVAKELGIRTSLAYEVTDRDGAQACEMGIRENIDFIKHTQKQRCGMLSGMFGLHASLTLSEKTLEKCVEAMGSLDAGYHIHTAEGIADVFDSLEKYGKRVVNRLLDANILGRKTICVHCVHVSPAEIELLAHTETMVVHNPESNMGNAVGCGPVLQMLDSGVTLGLGTDGYTSDMFESLKVANIIHKHHLCDPSVAWGEAPEMLFGNNKKITECHFGGSVGVISKGSKADIAVVDYNPLTPMDETNVNGHILFGMMGKSVDSTMINGRFVYKNRELLVADEQQIFAKSREQAADFWKRVNS